MSRIDKKKQKQEKCIEILETITFQFMSLYMALETLCKHINFTTDNPADLKPGDIFYDLENFQTIIEKIIEIYETAPSEDKKILRQIKISCLEISNLLISENCSNLGEYKIKLFKRMFETLKKFKAFKQEGREVKFSCSSQEESEEVLAMLHILNNVPVAIFNLLEGKENSVDFFHLGEDFYKNFKYKYSGNINEEK